MTQRYYEKTADILKALAQPTRLKIVDLLRDGERCVCEIFPALEQEQPNVSKHLNMMKKVGILECRKDGLRIMYRLKNPDVLEILRHAGTILGQELEEDQRALGRV